MKKIFKSAIKELKQPGFWFAAFGFLLAFSAHNFVPFFHGAFFVLGISLYKAYTK